MSEQLAIAGWLSFTSLMSAALKPFSKSRIGWAPFGDSVRDGGESVQSSSDATSSSLLTLSSSQSYSGYELTFGPRAYAHKELCS